MNFLQNAFLKPIIFCGILSSFWLPLELVVRLLDIERQFGRFIADNELIYFIFCLVNAFCFYRFLNKQVEVISAWNAVVFIGFLLFQWIVYAVCYLAFA